MTPFENEQLREKIEMLAGGRGSNRRRAAARLEDLAGLLDLPPRLKSAKAAGSNPTRAEFDALQADVEMLFLRLTALREALQRRILP